MMLLDSTSQPDAGAFSKQIGLVVAFAGFLLVVVWTLTRSRREMQNSARIPLEDTPVEPRVGRPDNSQQAMKHQES